MTSFFEPAGRGVQHSDLRATNRRAVLTTIAFNAGISNAEISRRTGLAPQTASAIVTELEADGLITRGEVLRGRRGQPATPLFLNFSGAYVIGCEVGARHVELWLTDLGSRRIGHYRRDFDYPEPESVAEEIARAAAELVDRLDAGQRQRLIGVGLAVSCNIARQMQVLAAPDRVIKGWESFDLAARVQDLSGLETASHNTGAATCWSELLVTPAPRPADFVQIYIGSFLATGLFAGHALWQGPTGNAANLGAMRVIMPDGSLQFGHHVAALATLERQLAAAGMAVPRTDPLLWPWQDWEQIVAPWIEDAAHALAQILLNTSAVIEFERAIIGGSLPQDIVGRLATATDAHLAALPNLMPTRPSVASSRYGEQAPAFGAAYLMVYRRFFANNPFELLRWSPTLALD